ncbi:MAG: hypothetical protein P8L38_01570 [Gammaproteobacteria bacterium]|jgi:hypothetical protein|nr:hypothetical protein [Gammaproteobacteria bacterium]
MSFRIIQLEELEVSLNEDSGNISMSFKDAFIKKTMDDAEEKTLWVQSGSIELRNAKEQNNFSLKNDKISFISISYDFYTYKNILILPFLKKGGVLVDLKLENINKIINIQCDEVEILLEGDPKYVKHIKKTE